MYQSLSARRAWIEIDSDVDSASGTLSLSARRAWIEISSFLDIGYYKTVALRKESVDRNQNCCPYLSSLTRVALRKESVDRNRLIRSLLALLIWSLSARRAWIEIYNYIIRLYWRIVALRKESVDRNGSYPYLTNYHFSRSPQGERG